MKNQHEFRIVLTPFCNYRCFFCHHEGHTEEHTPLSLTPSDYGFIAKLGKETWGWDTITITGGEPLISPIYKETCREIAKQGVKITVVTNASLLSNPKKLLADVSQVNISLHSLDPEIYSKITGTGYPVDRVVETIVTTRVMRPDIAIHLNTTVIKGMNDSRKNYEDIIRFAGQIGGQAKFVDLASTNPQLIVPVDDIVKTLAEIGFTKADENAWQIKLTRNEEEVFVTRCGFADANRSAPLRNLFVNSDSSLSTDADNLPPVNLLREIHERNAEGFIRKAEWIFPPAKASRII